MADPDDLELQESLLDELEALKAFLGKKYRRAKPTDALSEPPEAAIRQLLSGAAPRDQQPPTRPPPSLVHSAQAALEANQALQDRLKKLLNSISIAQDKNLAIRERVKETLRLRQSSSGPLILPSTSSALGNPTGGSWFWTVPGGPPPPANPDTADVGRVTFYLPLVFKRTLWSDETRALLAEGVLQLAQEQQLAVLMEEMETEVRAGGAVSVEEFQKQQEPIKNLKVDSQEVLEAASKFTDADWATIAHRYLPGKTSTDCRLQWMSGSRPGLCNTDFTAAEDALLEQLVEEDGERSWRIVAQALGGHRTPLKCMSRYQQLQAKQQPSREFTAQDLQRLEDLVRAQGQHWKRIAKEFGGCWDSAQLMHLWRRHEQRKDAVVGPRKGKWSQEEDEALRRAVALKGRKWAEVAKLVPGRTDVQCRERYSNVLDPEVKKDRFSDEEYAQLERLVEEHKDPSGKIKWALVAAGLPGRTDNHCMKVWSRRNKSQSAAARRGNGRSGNGQMVKRRGAGGGAGRKKVKEDGAGAEEMDLTLQPSKSGRKRQMPAWMSDVTKL